MGTLEPICIGMKPWPEQLDMLLMMRVLVELQEMFMGIVLGKY